MTSFLISAPLQADAKVKVGRVLLNATSAILIVEHFLLQQLQTATSFFFFLRKFFNLDVFLKRGAYLYKNTPPGGSLSFLGVQKQYNCLLGIVHDLRRCQLMRKFMSTPYMKCIGCNKYLKENFQRHQERIHISYWWQSQCKIISWLAEVVFHSLGLLRGSSAWRKNYHFWL